MFSSKHDTAYARRIVGALAALGILLPTIQPTYAQSLVSGPYPHGGAALYAGHTAMLNLRIPLGGEARFRPPPTLGLSVGPSWRNAPGALYPVSYNFVPTAEARLTFGGDPVLKFGSFDVGALHAAAEETEASTFCGRNLALCIGGAVVIVGAIWVAVGAVYDTA